MTTEKIVCIPKRRRPKIIQRFLTNSRDLHVRTRGTVKTYNFNEKKKKHVRQCRRVSLIVDEKKLNAVHL
jgi:hypothetical protein